jgi:hypothetical protein
VADGDTIVAFAWSWGSQTTSLVAGDLVNERGDPYELAIARTSANSCGGSVGAIGIFYRRVPSGQSDRSITMTPSTQQGYQELQLIAVDYAGVSVLDTVFAHEAASTPSPDRFDSGEITTAGDNELVVAVGQECSGNPNVVTWAELDGFDVLAVETTTDFREPGIATQKLATAAGSYIDHWSTEYMGPAYETLGAIAAFR